MQTQWSTGANDGLGGAPAGGGSGAPAPGVAPEGAVLVDEVSVGDAPGEEDAHRTAVDEVDGLLDEVELALSRLDDGTYGRCEECGTTIADARLAVSPTVRTCGTCVIGGGDPTDGPGRAAAASVGPTAPGGAAGLTGPTGPHGG